MKKCKNCGKEIPNTRKKSAEYCSDECYYIQKKLRSSLRYQKLKNSSPLTIKYEKILAYLFGIQLLGKSVNMNDLKGFEFNFGYSEGDVVGGNKLSSKKIGSYCYYINPDKTVQIWKLK